MKRRPPGRFFLATAAPAQTLRPRFPLSLDSGFHGNAQSQEPSRPRPHGIDQGQRRHRAVDLRGSLQRGDGARRRRPARHARTAAPRDTEDRRADGRRGDAEQPAEGRRARPRAWPRPQGGQGGQAARSDRQRQHGHRGRDLAQGGRRQARARPQRRQPAARPRPRRLERAGADDQHGRRRRRQPELAQGRPARTDPDGGLHPPREDHPLRPRAHPGADRPRARLGGARLLRELPGPVADHARGAVRGGRQAHAGLRPLLDRRRRARLVRPRPRRARLRGQVLHGRGQLGHRRQQHPGLLHPGRDEVPRPRPRRQARAAQRDAAGGERARHVLGLRLADARVDPHADVGDVGPRDPAQLPDDAGLRRAHLPARQRPGRVALLQVPLGAGRGHALGGLGRGRQDQRRRPRLPSPRPLGGDRGGRVSRVGARPAGLHRGGGRPLQLRHPRRHQDRPRGARPGAQGRPHGPRPQPRQLLRRDRAGRVRHDEHDPRHRHQQRSRCCRAATTRTSTPS